MKYNEINKKLHDKAFEYIMDGYIINAKTMTGHQGEEGKIDLVKGEELIRIWISKEYCHRYDKEKWCGTQLILRIGRWIYPASTCYDSWTHVWMKDLDVLSEEVYYEIGTNWYVTDEQEALRVQSMRRTRYMQQLDYSRYYCDDLRKEIGVRYLKRHHGYQRVSRDKLSIEKSYHAGRDHSYYKIMYNGNVYLMK